MENLLTAIGEADIKINEALKHGKLLENSEINTAERSARLVIECDNEVDDESLCKLKEAIKNKLNLSFISVELVYKNNENSIDEIMDKRREEEAELVARALSQKGSKKNEYVVFGKMFKGKSTPIGDIVSDYGKIIVQGDVFREVKKTKTKRGMFVYIISITDYTGSIYAKLICNKDKLEESVKKGMRVKIQGELILDTYEREDIIKADDIIILPKEVKTDDAEKKRVELHCHTKMSMMDAVVSVEDVVSAAAQYGHCAVAITDHGVVQAFPQAYEAARKHKIKIIYGVECYLINDGIPTVTGVSSDGLDGEFVVFDLETTGLSAQNNEIIEIGAVKIKNRQITDTFGAFVKPSVPIPAKITEITRINDTMVADADAIAAVLPEFIKFAGNAVLAAHNASFDMSFIREACRRQGTELGNAVIDTLQMSRSMFPKLPKHRLNDVAKHLGVELINHHRAVNDAETAGKILLACFEILSRDNVNSVDKINEKLIGLADIKKEHAYHAIILVKNQTGLRNLYKLISISHLHYFYKKPRILKSLYIEHSEGLMIGSACEAGELFTAVLEGRPNEEINALARFYDYYELQPLGNNAFLIRNERLADEQALININKKILELGAYYKKPVVATGDVHFLHPHDEIFRRIIMTAQEYSDADFQAPLYFRTTDEMLAEFRYLDDAAAREIVIDNTQKIAGMIENIKPVPDGLFPPQMEGAEDSLSELCYARAHEIYGDELPDIVSKRIEKELVPIVKNGYAVMYMIAQKLVAKSVADGYLVGSRGSVGSSLVAFLTGITEVNALVPHYICPKCKHSEFDDSGKYISGYDMPDKICPTCNIVMKKDGHDIPFETFLGFKAEKVPDIDLNFSGEYQANAHKYLEELFGSENTFRAGTIGTIADNTAYGYVKKYIEKKNLQINKAETDRLVKGCEEVKRTTGRHPGGIVVVPRDNDIYNFTPVQYPADDRESGVITTHFDFDSMHDTLLKFDILGHANPTVIRMLEDLTGIRAANIPLDDPSALSLFNSTDALGVKPADINSNVGTLGVPEFGTEFVRQMLEDTAPATFGELVRITGVAHGEDVWIDNARDLIKKENLTLMDVICTRDDIMTELMRKGLPALSAFNIMELVRKKDKTLTEAYEAEMRSYNVPEWFIQSCKKITYMFPKAHAVAYVMMAVWTAYYKVHYPIEFYMAYFTIRAGDFNADIMCRGQNDAKGALAEIKKLEKPTQKDKNTLTILELCIEMYARGLSFLPIDIEKSDAIRFLSANGKILPPLNALAGVGTNAALSIMKARCEEAFFSIEDMANRAKLTKPVIEALRAFGCLDNMEESSQLSLFAM